MKTNIYEFKSHIAHYLQLVEQGEYIVICKRNVPIAELRKIPGGLTEDRPIGLAKGKVQLKLPF